MDGTASWTQLSCRARHISDAVPGSGAGTGTGIGTGTVLRWKKEI